MRTLTAAANTKFSTLTGIKPRFIVEIDWTPGTTKSYADIDIQEGTTFIPGVLNSVGGLDNVIVINGVQAGSTGDSQSLTIRLNDSSGAIKKIRDKNDIHKRPVRVYLWEEDLTLADKVLLFTGLVSSPINWNKGDETVELTVINQLESNQVGFSIEEGNFPFAPAELIGKAWPLVFGTAIHVPALRITPAVRGILKKQFVIRDFTLERKLDQLEHLCCPLVFMGFRLSGLATGQQQANSIFMPDPSCWCKLQADKTALAAEIARQKNLEANTATIEIENGSLFPQGQRITLICNGAKITGKFQGTTQNPSDVFVIDTRRHPERDNITLPKTRNFCTNLGAIAGFGLNNAPIYNSRFRPTFNAPRCVDLESGSDTIFDIGWDYLSRFPDADIFNAEAGCEVFLDTNEPDVVYVANLLPSTIHRVAAFRNFPSGARVLSTLPTSFYSTRVSDFNGYNVQEIVMNKPPSQQADGWEDDLFISMDSSVGPNAVDIIEFLIDTYTNFTKDTANFADIKSKLTVYHNSVVLLERENIIDVLQKIAFDNRCAIILRNNEFKLFYLSEDRSADFSITESDLVPGSLTLTHTDTEDLVTSFRAEWQDDYARDPKRFIVNHNINKYGTQVRDFRIGSFNIFKWVEKSSTFWTMRMAHTWQRLKFRTRLNHIAAEVFDVVSLTLPDFASGNTIRGVVEKASYDSNSQEIEFEIWTPVRAGEDTPFDRVQPRLLDVVKLWPTNTDIANNNAGSLGGFNTNVQPPNLHPLGGPSGFQSIQLESYTSCATANGIGTGAGITCRPEFGDRQPSDQDDTVQTKSVPGKGEVAPVDNNSQNPTGRFQLFQRNIDGMLQDIKDNTAQNQSTIQRSQDAGSGKENDEHLDGDPKTPTAEELQQLLDELPDTPQEACFAAARVCWFVNVRRVRKTDGTLTSQPGEVGTAVLGDNNPSDNCEIFYFNSLKAAEAFGEKMRQIAGSPDATVGEPWPAASPTGPLHQTNSLNWTQQGCQEPAQPDVIAYNRSGTGTPGSAEQGFI